MAQFTKADLVERLSELNDIETRAAAGRIVETIFGTIKDEIIAGNDVRLAGFVNIKPSVQAAKLARPGRNPATGAEMQLPAVPAKNTARISLTAPFKAALNP